MSRIMEVNWKKKTVERADLQSVWEGHPYSTKRKHALMQGLANICKVPDNKYFGPSHNNSTLSFEKAATDNM